MKTFPNGLSRDVYSQTFPWTLTKTTPAVVLHEPEATCSHIGDCGCAYQACCIGFGAKGYPCGCTLQDGNGTAGSTCGDCGTAYAACCIGFKARGYPCECQVDA